MRILVCGGRNFGNTFVDDNLLRHCRRQERRFIWDKLNGHISPNCTHNDITIISGKAPGVDSIAVEWATFVGVKFEEYPAKWDQYGKAAGYIRNIQMLDEGKPDLVVAFPGGKGTAMMIKLAKERGVEVIEYAYSN